MPLGSEQWSEIARQAPWQMTRMNLNTFARHGVFADEASEIVDRIARRLADPEAIRKARAYPYQLLAAWLNTGNRDGNPLPAVIREALQAALEVSVDNVPELAGQVHVLVDVSGSMSSPVTGVRHGATSAVRCIEAAALVASAVLRKNPLAQVIAFNQQAWKVDLNPRDALVTNAQKLTALLNGGTAVSSGLALLNGAQAKGDLVLVVSDNQSWADTARRGTATMQEWEAFRARNPRARLACIDLQPYGTMQAAQRPEVLHVGGFSDAVFDVLASFASGQMDSDFWVKEIERTELN